MKQFAGSLQFTEALWFRLCPSAFGYNLSDCVINQRIRPIVRIKFTFLCKPTPIIPNYFYTMIQLNCRPINFILLKFKNSPGYSFLRSIQSLRKNRMKKVGEKRKEKRKLLKSNKLSGVWQFITEQQSKGPFFVWFNSPSNAHLNGI